MCDALVALGPATDTGATLWAKNSDRPPDEAQAPEWFPARRDDGPVRATHVEVAPGKDDTIGFLGSRPWWCWGVEQGVNVAGVAVGNETIYTTLDPRGAPDGLIGMDLVRLGLERADSASAAVEVMTELLERYGQGGSGHYAAPRPYWSSFLIADPEAAWVLETSGREWAVEAVTRTRAVSNRTTIPTFDAVHRHPRQPVERLVDPRWHASQAVLADEPVTIAAVAAHLRSHDAAGGWSVCMHVPGVEATTASMIATLRPARDAAPLVRCLMGSPCSSVYVPLIVGGPLGAPPAWQRFAELDASCRPLLDDLERSLADDITGDVVDGEAWAVEAWGRVAQVLSAAGSV